MKSSIKKQTALIIASILLVSTSYAQLGKKVKGNGNMTTVTRTTSDYESIKCAGSFDYILVEGNEGQIKLEGEENLLEYIIVEVKNNALIVKVKDHASLSPSQNKTIKVTIPFKDINAVSLSGSGDLWNEDVITSDNLEVSLAGSGDVVLNVNAAKVKGALSGSGDLTLKGNTNNLIASLAGSGDIHAADLKSNHTEVAVAGSGDAKVVSLESLKARVAGSGSIVYSGNPSKEDSKVSGSGSIWNN
jgi:Putative auto-transporter adhesin, head GIN domain